MQWLLCKAVLFWGVFTLMAGAEPMPEPAIASNDTITWKIWERQFPDGKSKALVHLKKGLADSSLTLWNKSGIPFLEGNYRAGRLHGPLTIHHGNGKKWMVTIFDLGAERAAARMLWDSAGVPVSGIYANKDSAAAANAVHLPILDSLRPPSDKEAVVEKHRSHIRELASDTLLNRIPGELKAQILIAPDGSVAYAYPLRNALLSWASMDTILKSIENWKFPATGSAALETYMVSFAFTPMESHIQAAQPDSSDRQELQPEAEAPSTASTPSEPAVQTQEKQESPSEESKWEGSALLITALIVFTALLFID